MSRIEAAFRTGPALIPYVVAGDPTPAATQRYVTALERGGADIIELGLPFSEPIAEGPTIQRAINRSLAAGMTPPRYFALVESLRVDVPLVCMTYYNLIYRYGDRAGPDAFLERAAEVGIDGLIVADIPVDEATPLATACAEHNVDLIVIVAPTTTAERLKRIEDLAQGFVYVQARLGTTGVRSELSDRTAACVDRVADWELPAGVGFGIKSGEQARRVVAAGADGVIVGSAFVDIIETAGEDVATRLEHKACELREGIDAAVDPVAPAVQSILSAVGDRSRPEQSVCVTARSLPGALVRVEHTGCVPLIAEIKRTSPTSDRHLEFDAAAIARDMVAAGAAAISVITEPTAFGGSVADLRRVREAVSVPVLRKDFILEEAQLDVVPTDVVLLIARFVDDLAGMIDATRERGMQALVEVHSPEELERALAADASIIGINNRDLAQLTVDLETFGRIAPDVPPSVTLLAESGLQTRADVRQMRNAGANGVLVGTAIHAGDPAQNVRRLTRPLDRPTHG